MQPPAMGSVQTICKHPFLKTAEQFPWALQEQPDVGHCTK